MVEPMPDGESLAAASGKPLNWGYQVYNCFTLMLSCIILFCVLLIHEMSRSASVLPHAFQMITLRKRRMFCFEVDISSGPCARKVRMHYMWLLRTAILVVGCYVWQTCLLSYWAIDYRDTSARASLVTACTVDDADCFGSRHNYDFFSVNAAPPNLCVKYSYEDLRTERIQEEIRENYRYITCIGFVRPDTLTYTQHLAIAYALTKMIITLFEVLVWFLYRSRSSLLAIVVLVVGIIFLGVWVGSIFIPRLLTFFGSWIGYVMLLSVPLVLWTALMAAHNLRKIQHQKWTLWQIQANRPVATAEDPAGDYRRVRSSSAMLDADYGDETRSPGAGFEPRHPSEYVPSPRQKALASPFVTSAAAAPAGSAFLQKASHKMSLRFASGVRSAMPARYQLASTESDNGGGGKKDEDLLNKLRKHASFSKKDKSEKDAEVNEKPEDENAQLLPGGGDRNKQADVDAGEAANDKKDV
ncbi:hypothetical protein BESB_010010 [Besnoitia besnoiti]|uniref:Transmembrane protein n=1 Tax=Besnoitia besnoiti TaxID=94643 RepID=A0A2A9ML17_BESBE|nr:hypothetical protein BESB_010010 [Besnoitia besnoiti]PFH38659.1 hypothetical protein BESB_010010 [Besnoitia besnoiti]